MRSATSPSKFTFGVPPVCTAQFPKACVAFRRLCSPNAELSALFGRVCSASAKLWSLSAFWARELHSFRRFFGRRVLEGWAHMVSQRLGVYTP